MKRTRRPALPIRAIAGNVIFSGDTPWACFRVECRSYRAEPKRRRASIASELRAYAQVAEADFQVIRVSQRFEPEKYVSSRSTAFAEVRDDLLLPYLERQRALLDGLDTWTPAVFICVRLAPPNLDLQGKANRLLERTLDPREAWNEFRVRASVRDSYRSQDVADRARVAEARVVQSVEARPARFDEIQWLIRRSFCRGLVEPPASPEEPDKSTRSVKRWFGESGLRPEPLYLRSEGEFGEWYQSGFCLGEMLHASPFSRQVELMFSAIEDFPWPIDASLNVRYVPNDQAKRKTRTLFARTSNQRDDEEQTAHGAMGEAHERVALARELHDRLGATGEPLLEGTLSFMLSAGTTYELKHRAQTFRDGFPWPVYRPYGDQVDVWRSHLPGQPSRVAGFERTFTCEQIGAMVPQATHEVGSHSDRSFYIAKSRYGRQPVFQDLGEASETDQPPTIVCLGTLGGGKTMFLQTLLYQAFKQNARIVDTDPKGDHRFHLLPEVAPHVQTIELDSTDEHAGKLDPLRIALRGERHDAAANFLIDVLHDPDEDVRASIYGAVAKEIVEHGERACCSEVVARLEADGKKAGELLRSYCDGGIVRLGFAKLDDELPAQAEKQVTYLNIRALRRASVDTVRSEMSQAQRHGRAVLQLVALYAMKILGEDRDRLKVLGFDESSFIAEDAMGNQLLDTLQRWARSEYAVPIVSTQLLKDVVKQDNLVGQWFIFAMKARDEAIQTLRQLELDTEGPLPAVLTEQYGQDPYPKGLCLYVDLKRRCEEIQIDPGPDLVKAFGTRPGERGAREAKVAA